jgi:hypothetical protein
MVNRHFVDYEPEELKVTRRFEYLLLRKAGLSVFDARRCRDFRSSKIYLIIERGHL